MKNYRLFKIVFTLCLSLVAYFSSIQAQTFGRGQMISFESNWAMNTMYEQYNWYQGWDMIIPIDIDNDNIDELLFYSKNSPIANPGKALADIFDVNAQGELTLIKRHTNWSKNWDRIIPMDINSDGRNELLCYSKDSPSANAGKALADIYKVTSTGDVPLIKRHTNWYNNWDEMLPVDIDGDGRTELLCYSKYNPSNPSKAFADFYDLTTAGDAPLIKRHTNWFKGWDNIFPMDIDNDGTSELLFYSEEASIAEEGKALGDFFDITNTGEVPLIKRYTNFSRGWDNIICRNLGGSNQAEVLFYARGSQFGLAKTYSINRFGILDLLAVNTDINPEVDILLPIDIHLYSPSKVLFYSKKFGKDQSITPFGYNGGDGWNKTQPNGLIGSSAAAWIVLNFPDGPNELNSNLDANSLNKVADYFSEVSEGRFIVNNIPIIGPINVERGCGDFPDPLATNFRNFAIEQAVAHGLDISSYDTSPRDGIVTPLELAITVVSNCPAGSTGAAAITRHADVNVDGVRYVGGVSTGGANMNLITMLHELMHVYGNAFDLYSGGGRTCTCGDVTLMGGTVNTSFNSPLIHVDPFHRLVYGWMRPQAFDLAGFPPTKIDIKLTRGGSSDPKGRTPFIIYDSSRGTNEYFIVEYRSNSGSEFDARVPGKGIAVWRIKKNSDGNFTDRGVELMRTPNNSGLWSTSHGLIDLNWSDGASSPFVIDILPISSDSDMATLEIKPRTITINNSLPVELVHFAAEEVNNKSVALEWEVEMESNLSHYEIERSMDTEEWNLVVKTSPVASLNYRHLDSKAIDYGRRLFYRLKIVNIDGSFEYSPIRQVRFRAANRITSLAVYPNPASDKLQIDYLIPGFQQQGVIQITNQLGQLIATYPLATSEGNLELVTANWSNGIYYYSLVANNQLMQSGRFVVSH